MGKSQKKQQQSLGGSEDRNALSAAFIAAGIGIAIMGIIQFIAELVEPFNDALAWNQALGPYSGMYVIAYAAWLVSWAILYPVARAGKISLKTSLITSIVLITIGAILLFPPFIFIFK